MRHPIVEITSIEIRMEICFQRESAEKYEALIEKVVDGLRETFPHVSDKQIFAGIRWAIKLGFVELAPGGRLKLP